MLTGLSFLALCALPVQPQHIRYRITSGMVNYINLVACTNEQQNTVDNLTLFPITHDLEPKSLSIYLVPWQGDLGCNGGTGSFQTHISLITVFKNGKFIISQSDILQTPALTSIEKEFITDVKMIKQNTLEITAGERKGAIDAHTPSKYTRYVVRVNLTADQKTFTIIDKNHEKW